MPGTKTARIIERVAKMEEASRRVEDMLELLNQGLDRYAQVRDDIRMLGKYLDSPQWRADFEADEAGKLPAGMPRGVLSEDGLYDLLDRVRRTEERIETIARSRRADEGKIRKK